MTTQTRPIKYQYLRRVAISVVLLLVAVYILARNQHVVSASLHITTGANDVWLLAALCLAGLTFCIAAAVYVTLALHPLRYGQTLLVELASSFVNRLLPAGLGGLGLHGAYLFRRRHTPAQATAIVSVNNLLGITAHLCLLSLVIIIKPEILQKFTAHYDDVPWRYVSVVIVAMPAVLLVRKVRHSVANFSSNLFISLRKLRTGHVLAAFLMALSLTMTYTFILVCVVQSLGLHLSVPQTFVVFSVGMLVGTATPTPGGLVGMEAGLYTGFVSYGVSAVDAGAAVLLYRLVTYWLPLLPGLGALLVARRDRFV